MLELRDVGYRAEDGKEILKGINLKVDDRIVAITGPNGGGKSTLAKVISGLFQATQGQIILDGTDITNLSITERAKEGVSLAFQQPVRFKGLTVQDLITIAAGRKLTLTEVCSYLSEVGLCAKDYVKRELNGNLSGGEMKRIEIAMILARNSKLSIFDEPEAGIDLWSFQSLIHVFEKMQSQSGGTILIISHQERILEIADKIIYVKDGMVEKYGSGEEILPQLLGDTAKPGCNRLMDKMEE